MKTIKITDFTFEKKGYGHYFVTYTSPSTGNNWGAIVTDMTVIDSTKNADNTKIKDLNNLKRICKHG